jgi:hypothetical protein
LDDAEILDGGSRLLTLLLVVVDRLGISSECGGDDACDIMGDFSRHWTSEFALPPSLIGEAAADWSSLS